MVMVLAGNGSITGVTSMPTNIQFGGTVGVAGAMNTSSTITNTNQPSGMFYYSISGINFGTAGQNFVNATWSYPVPFVAYITSRNMSVASDGTRASRITVGATGRYMINVQLHLDIYQSIRAFGMLLDKNGSTINGFYWSSFYWTGSGATHPSVNYSYMCDLAANDYLQCKFTAYDSPGSYYININSYFSIQMIG